MRIGISISSSYRVEDPSLGARYMIERAATARQADLDSLFIGDHHVTPQPYYQNSPMLGRLLAEWNNKPAGCAVSFTFMASSIAGRANCDACRHHGGPVYFAMCAGRRASAK